jgi:hypothetical protein
LSLSTELTWLQKIAGPLKTKDLILRLNSKHTTFFTGIALMLMLEKPRSPHQSRHWMEKSVWCWPANPKWLDRQRNRTRKWNSQRLL